MRIYTEAEMETLHARELLVEWKREGLLTTEQSERLLAENASDLRTTHLFLRLVLLFFTLLATSAAVALFFALPGFTPTDSPAGVCLLLFSSFCYFCAELAVTKARLYRFGIEEGLTICFVAFLSIGLYLVFSQREAQSFEHAMLVSCAAGALSSLWLWYRFGFWYAFPAAMIFIAGFAQTFMHAHTAQRLLDCLLYGAGLAAFMVGPPRDRISPCLRRAYALAEAFLWLGVYLALNLKLPDLISPRQWWDIAQPGPGFPAPFYWATWVLCWCLPPVLLARGVRRKDHRILAAGMFTCVLTLITNKPYLGWARHTWDPMLLGAALITVAVLLLRWFARAPGGIRHGFAAARLTGKQAHMINIASSVMGFVSPHAFTPASQPHTTDFQAGFGGGSGGGGAGGDF